MTDQDDTTPIAEETVPPETVPEPEPVPPETVPEPEPVVPAGAEQPRFDRRMILLGVGSGIAAVLVVLLLLMVFAPAVAPVKLGSSGKAVRAAETDEVEEVSRRFATSFYSFNYRTIEADLEKISDDVTGKFARELDQVLGGDVDVVKDAIVKARGESTGRVEGVDVIRVDGNTAVAKVFTVQAIKNKNSPKGRQEVSGIELTLVHTSGGWKVDGVEQFLRAAPGPTQ